MTPHTPRPAPRAITSTFKVSIEEVKNSIQLPGTGNHTVIGYFCALTITKPEQKRPLDFPNGPTFPAPFPFIFNCCVIYYPGFVIGFFLRARP